MRSTTQQSEAMEIHLDAPQIAALWGFDKKTVIDAFRNEPGVIWKKGESRETMRVPMSVVDRVHRKLQS
jgi:hypothetical protein